MCDGETLFEIDALILGEKANLFGFPYRNDFESSYAEMRSVNSRILPLFKTS